MVLTVVLLGWYDLRLKAEYLSGAYRIPYSNYTTLKYTGFDMVDLNASTAANVKFVQGPFSVRVDNNALDYAVLQQQGNRLVIDAVFERNYQWNPNPYVIVISCPTLTKLTTGAYLPGPIQDHGYRHHRPGRLEYAAGTDRGVQARQSEHRTGLWQYGRAGRQYGR